MAIWVETFLFSPNKNRLIAINANDNLHLLQNDSDVVGWVGYIFALQTTIIVKDHIAAGPAIILSKLGNLLNNKYHF